MNDIRVDGNSHNNIDVIGETSFWKSRFINTFCRAKVGFAYEVLVDN
ncbi:MAG: hypothetical protein BroJett021_30000 [Chloroflexota bacterium]|nr:MAG: hypothetical protein BroJett021_30000 [Chloroflexota bacterium]